MKPLIGVTCSFSNEYGQPPRPRMFLNAAYSDAIFAAGGLPQPLALPPDPTPEIYADLLRRCDGLLFTGGDDLDPRHYGQRPHARTDVMAARRDAFELDFFRAADTTDTPVLAICLGCQIASVGRGGCLVQHVDDLPAKTPVVHHLPDFTSAYHQVRVEPDSKLAKIARATAFEVNSRHHQVVHREQLGGKLRPVAFAPDGVVEAVEDPGPRFLIAVQWHPEDLTDRPEHLRLFQALVEAAKNRAEEARNRATAPRAAAAHV